MPQISPVSQEERDSIEQALRAGAGIREVARQFGRSTATISKIAQRGGVPIGGGQVGARNLDKRRQRRLRTIDLAYQRIRAHLIGAESASEIRAACQALALVIDREAALILGEASNVTRHESVTSAPIDRELEAFAAELRARAAKDE